MAIPRFTKMTIIPLTVELHQKLKEEAKSLNISMSAFVRYFLFKHFKDKESEADNLVLDEKSRTDYNIEEINNRMMKNNNFNKMIKN